MGAGSGLALKSGQWFIRGIQLACSVLVLAIYSYFLATLHNHDLSISTSVRAVEGISGVACLYTLLAVLFVCCFAGRTLPSFLGVVLDVAFIAAFIYVAVANKTGAGSCTGTLDTPFGTGKADEKAKGGDGFTSIPTYHVACRLQTVCLSVAIIAIFFFIFSILMTVALARHHHREKRLGPSPQNNYTEGYGKPGGFFSRLFKRKTHAPLDDGNMLPEHPQPSRESHGTDRTAVGNDQEEGVYNKYETTSYGYPHPEGQGRQDGYGYIHYPEPEEGAPRPNQQQNQHQQAYIQPGHAQPAYNQPGYRYDDGVYDRV